MITIELSDKFITFIEWTIYISAVGCGIITAFNVLKKEEGFVQFLTGDLDD